jgi:hypothetical protein
MNLLLKPSQSRPLRILNRQSSSRFSNMSSLQVVHVHKLKSLALSVEHKHVQRHRNVRVILKVFLFSIFLNILCQTAKKFALSRDTSMSPGRDVVSCVGKKSLGQSRLRCLRKRNVVDLVVNVHGIF